MSKRRCQWAQKEVFHKYHDEEWGIPVHDDQRHFELLSLEGAQAGLSWETVLKKREAYRDAFSDFDPEVVAAMPHAIISELMQRPALIRHRGKLESVLRNARLFLQVQQEFGSFDTYVWRFVANKQIVNKPRTLADFQTCSKESDALSKDLKKRGFKFVGTTIMYAYFQAVGLVNDHEAACWRIGT